jgi:hypothetical protein
MELGTCLGALSLSESVDGVGEVPHKIPKVVGLLWEVTHKETCCAWSVVGVVVDEVTIGCKCVPRDIVFLMHG